MLLYQAYSNVYFKPEESPLRDEVQDLWERRGEQEIIDKLSPFANRGDNFNNRMLFHNAVMRWKCSLLNEDERRQLEEWVENDAQERWEEVKHPWKVKQTQDMDEMTAENRFIQEYVCLISSSPFEVDNLRFSARSTPSQPPCRRPWTRSRG